MNRVASRLIESVAHRWPLSRARRFARAVDVAAGADLIHIGSDYGGWSVPRSALAEGAVCYCGGVGADISFDLGLVERHGCEVYAFDPTPRAAALASAAAADHDRYHFLPYGLWGEDTTLTFFAPPAAADRQQVENWSVGDGDGDGEGEGEGERLSIEAECRSLSSLMKELGHERIDILKLDIEGAEYSVLDAALRDGVDFAVLCVEFHKTPSIDLMVDMTRRLESAGYEAVSLEGFDVTFVRPNA